MQNEINALVKTITKNEIEIEQLREVCQKQQARIKELQTEVAKLKTPEQAVPKEE